MLTFIEKKTFLLESERDEYYNRTRANFVWKRWFDLIVSFLVTVSILVWLIPIISFLIVITSPGPPLFIQYRTGRNGKIFRCLKFRTMTYQRNSTFRQTARNDDRITGIGSYLRSSNLDEMPQFLNVLMGQMSVVGPRPHAIQHDAEYWDSIPNYYERYQVLPGITGLAQIRGSRGLIEDHKKMRNRLRYDLLYIKNQSLLHDMKICWLTMKLMVIRKTNAW